MVRVTFPDPSIVADQVQSPESVNVRLVLHWSACIVLVDELRVLLVKVCVSDVPTMVPEGAV